MARFQHFKCICTWIDKYAYVYSGRKSHASSIDRAKRKRHLLTIPTDGGFPKIRYLRDKRGYVQRSHGGHHHKRYTATFQNPKHRCLAGKSIHVCSAIEWLLKMEWLGCLCFSTFNNTLYLLFCLCSLIRQAVLETTHTSLSLHFLFEPEKSPYAPSRRKSSAWRASSSPTVCCILAW